MTRSPEVICVVIPFLWGINTWPDVSKRFRFFGDNAWKIGLAALKFGLMLVPQAIYWHAVSGQWWYYG